tara:strand:+ start:1445 stop:1912 length:468 start_codon:yes stop_codon:yes gene_type:complete
MQNKLTIAEVLTKLDENIGTVFHKTLFTREEVIKLLNRIDEPQGDEGKINMTKAGFRAYVTDLFAKLSVSESVSNCEAGSWIEGYDYEHELYGNEIQTSVHSFEFGSEMYGEIECAQDQLLDVVMDNMCDDFSFIEETPQVETETPTETNGATEE